MGEPEGGSESSSDNVIGAERPELTLVEYGDFGYPHCFAAKLRVASLLERYSTMRLVWRHFPDPSLHPGADLAAELSELAADRRMLWDGHSLLLDGRQKFTREELGEVAERLGLDSDEARSALDDRRY